MSRVIYVTVHSYILVGRFHARMKICLHECTKGAPFNEQKRALRLTDAFEAAESAESAILRMARVNCNSVTVTCRFYLLRSLGKSFRIRGRKDEKT